VTYRILSIDGGGIRGIIPSVWLSHMESELGKPIHECFDMFVGTSTGAIIVSALSNKTAPQNVLDLFKNKSHIVFPSFVFRAWDTLKRTFTQGPFCPKYSGEGLKQILQESYGETMFGDLEKTTLITSFDTWHRRPFIMKSNHRNALLRPLWQVVKASSSAPTLFPAEPMEVKGTRVGLIDGAVAANNPAAIGIAEAVKLGQKIEDIWVLSLGTGAVENPIPVDKVINWGIIQWLPHALDVIMEGNLEVMDYISRKELQYQPEQPTAHCNKLTRYNRIQMPLDKCHKSLDNASKANVAKLESEALNYIDQEKELFDNIIQQLKS